MKNRSLRGSLLLTLGSMIWGAAFVAQRMGMDHMGPFTFTGIRMLLAAVMMLPVIAVSDRIRKKRGEHGGRRRGAACTYPVFRIGDQVDEVIALHDGVGNLLPA